MKTNMPIDMAAAYKSRAQIARVVTEGWGTQNLFCPACSADRLQRSPANTRAVDFTCPRCKQPFQLKGKSSPITNKVLDGAYDTMLAAVCSDTVPGLLLLQYDPVAWSVVNLTLVPHFAFPPSAIEKRKPLGASARRAGWTGCFIVLSRIPEDARVSIVQSGKVIPCHRVRAQYQRLLPLKQIPSPERGWTLDVFNIVRTLGATEFTNADVYARSTDLQALHPDNHNVTDKIRQQLQLLRDGGFIKHVGRGRWRMNKMV